MLKHNMKKRFVDPHDFLYHPRVCEFVEYLVGATALSQQSGHSFASFHAPGVSSEFVDDHTAFQSFWGESFYVEDVVIPRCYKMVLWAFFGNPDLEGDQGKYLPMFRINSSAIYDMLTHVYCWRSRPYPTLLSGASEFQLCNFTAVLCDDIIQMRADLRQVDDLCSVTSGHLWDADARRVHQSFTPFFVSRLSHFL